MGVSTKVTMVLGQGISLPLNSPGKSTPGLLHSAIQLCRFLGGRKAKKKKKKKKETKGKDSEKLKVVQENSTRAEEIDSSTHRED